MYTTYKKGKIEVAKKPLYVAIYKNDEEGCVLYSDLALSDFVQQDLLGDTVGYKFYKLGNEIKITTGEITINEVK